MHVFDYEDFFEDRHRKRMESMALKYADGDFGLKTSQANILRASAPLPTEMPDHYSSPIYRDQPKPPNLSSPLKEFLEDLPLMAWAPEILQFRGKKYRRRLDSKRIDATYPSGWWEEVI